ncbi:MAG: type 1 glutamine amidotransferase [Candidatus Omnitrophica bacterium]|nr:type 1 glutamine amidotransferase [Candidatus Omnitrophota bacterium]
MIYFLEHEPIEGPGMLKPLFENNGFATSIIKLYDDQALPDDFNEIEAIVSLGGPMNAYEEDKYPFLKKEDEFLKKIIKLDIPCLGICLGSQLIAKAEKAQVKKAEKEEIGWSVVKLTDQGKADDLFYLVNEELEVFHWHGDTFNLPVGAVLLAQGAACRNQAFKIGDYVYGLQFHLEVTDKEIFDWTEKYFNIADAEKQEYAKSMLSKYSEIKKDFELQMDVIGASFLKIIKKRNAVANQEI